MKTKIKTFQSACKYLGLDPVKALPKVGTMPKKHQLATLAHAQLVIIAEALNQEANGGKPWKPDWRNGQWNKYYPWFDLSSGSGLSCYGYVDRLSTSPVGSRLCYISSEVAKYAGTHFQKLYKQYFLL